MKCNLTPDEFLASKFLSTYFTQAGMIVKGIERTEDNQFLVHVEPSEKEQGLISEIIYKVKEPSFMRKD